MADERELSKQYDVVEHLLYKYWPKFPQASNKSHSARMGMSDPKRMVLLPKYSHLKGMERPRFCTFGMVHNRFHGRKMPSRSTEAFPDLYHEVVKLGRMLQKKFKSKDSYHDIHINASTVASKHLDGRQTGESIIVGLGDYTGGETVIYKNKEDNRGTKHNIYRQPLKFDANVTWHGSMPFKSAEGKTRFSIVFHPTKDHVVRSRSESTSPPLTGPVDYYVSVISTSATAVTKKTLPWLKRAQRGHMANVTVFVPSKADVGKHATVMAEAGFGDVPIIATTGTTYLARRMWPQRHFYTPNSKLVVMDDSVIGLVKNDDTPYTGTLMALAKKMFAECASKGTVLWGCKKTLRSSKAAFEVVPLQLFGCISGDAGIVGARPARVGGETADELETALRVYRRYGSTVIQHGVGIKGGHKPATPTAKALRDLHKIYSDVITLTSNGGYKIN